jgi:hypothetical protein
MIGYKLWQEALQVSVVRETRMLRLKRRVAGNMAARCVRQSSTLLAKDRSWNAGLELDTTGRIPGPGLLTAEEQRKVDAMMTRRPITITLK